MHKKIQLTINLSKINKDKITTRTYTDKNGVEQVVKEYKAELVLLAPEYQNVITSGDTWELKKVYRLFDGQTKEERKARVKGVILGEGLIFTDKEVVAQEDYDSINKELVGGVEYPSEDINVDSIPF